LKARLGDPAGPGNGGWEIGQETLYIELNVGRGK